VRIDSFDENRYVFYVAAAVAVGVSIFMNVVTDAEHAPAAGTALGLGIPGLGWSAVVSIIVGAAVLSGIRIVLGPRIVNLL
jgi:hypothetical protein